MARWDGIEECVAVAETRSFTRAAERLGSSVANISRQISRLEDRLDVQLFQRTTRSVTLTDDGRIYYNHCRALLDGLVEAEQAIGERLSEPTGRLRITAPLSYGERFIAPLIAGFTMHYPRLEIDLQLTNQRLDLIESGIDMAIRVGVLEDERLVARPLAHRAQFVCASPDYLARFGQPHTLAELKNHSCLLGTLDHWRFTDRSCSKTAPAAGPAWTGPRSRPLSDWPCRMIAKTHSMQSWSAKRQPHRPLSSREPAWS